MRNLWIWEADINVSCIWFYAEIYHSSKAYNLTGIHRTTNIYVGHVWLKCQYVPCYCICSINTMVLIIRIYLIIYYKVRYRCSSPRIAALLKILFFDICYGCLRSPVLYLQYTDISAFFHIPILLQCISTSSLCGRSTLIFPGTKESKSVFKNMHPKMLTHLQSRAIISEINRVIANECEDNNIFCLLKLCNIFCWDY